MEIRIDCPTLEGDFEFDFLNLRKRTASSEEGRIGIPLDSFHCPNAEKVDGDVYCRKTGEACPLYSTLNTLFFNAKDPAYIAGLLIAERPER